MNTNNKQLIYIHMQYSINKHLLRYQREHEPHLRCLVISPESSKPYAFKAQRFCTPQKPGVFLEI